MESPSTQRIGLRLSLETILIVLLIVALRVIGLQSYPAVMHDEGFWASGPRNWVLFGHPLMDGRLHSFLSPATFVALSLLFSVITPSLLSARCLSVVAGLLSCAVMGAIGRRYLPERDRLLLLVYGASGLLVFVSRAILVEPHQVFWLIIAASLWLDQRFLAAGAAFGIALLVKSNSLYLVPAFCLSLPRGADASHGRGAPLLSFLLIAALVASCGYLVAWAFDPPSFYSAFTFELDGAHLVNKHVLFYYGRAGLNPHLLNITTREVLLADPFVVLLGLAGMMSVVSRFSTAPPADRFFASWAAFGLLSNLIQIYPQYRYVTTITPALAYLGVRFVDRLLAGRRVGSGLPLSFDSSQALVLTLVLSFVAYQIAQVSLGIYRQPNRSYWRLVEWVSENVPNETRILVAPYIGISLPNRSYDFYRMIHRYDGLQRPLDQVLAEHDISSIIADDQWHKYQNADMKAFLAKRCTVKARVASFRIFTCDVTPDVLPGIPGATTVPTP